MSCDYVLCCACYVVPEFIHRLLVVTHTPEFFEMYGSGRDPIWKADYNIVKQHITGDHLAARQRLDHKISLAAALQYSQNPMSLQHLELKYCQSLSQ